jgi:hypothetical protein
MDPVIDSPIASTLASCHENRGWHPMALPPCKTSHLWRIVPVADGLGGAGYAGLGVNVRFFTETPILVDPANLSMSIWQ